MAIDLGYDESGSDQILLVSMQLGVGEDARKLKRRWRAFLRKHHLPYFHSKEFSDSLGGIFAGINRPKRERLLQNLVNLIRLRLRIGMTVRIDLSKYEETTSPEFRSRYGTAYSCAINVLLLGASLYMDVFKLGKDVNILVEDGHRNSRQALEILNDLKKSEPPQAPVRILTAALGSKRDHPILQAADMLAYSEWQKISAGDLAIYHHLHAPGNAYQPEMIDDCIPDLVKVFTDGAAEIQRQRIEFGRKRTQEIELRQKK